VLLSFRSLAAAYVKAIPTFRRFAAVCESDARSRPIYGHRSGSRCEAVERSLSDGRGTLLTCSSTPSAAHTSSSDFTVALNVVTTTCVAGLEQLQILTAKS
jgi:hypothetical protein